jgi:hypothetical protein
MGNLAVKCENRYQEKKAESKCSLRGTADVRLVKSDGDGDESRHFERSVLAAEVMLQFPDYVVVQWCPKKNVNLGRKGQLRVLQRHEVLGPGRIYILYPIPADFVKNNATRRSRRMQVAKDRLSMLLQRAELQPTAKASLKIAGEEVQSENGRSNDVTAKKSTLLIGLRDQRQNSYGNPQRKDGLPDPTFDLSSWFGQLNDSSWRPVLMSIPESPVGFHSRNSSRPDKPMTPVAFRIVSDREKFAGR